MTPEQRKALEDELAQRKRQLAKRMDEPGFAANCSALEARIAEIDALLGAIE